MRVSELRVNVWRGNIVESVHRVSAAVCDADGRTILGIGRGADFVTYWRSSAKPIQAVPIVTSGAADRYDVTPFELALFCASHSGRQLHTEGVSRVLDRIGLGAEALACGVHPPYDKAAANSLAERSESPQTIHNNCSGKHTGMLLLARHLGVDYDGYTEPSHPVQHHIVRAVCDVTGVAAPDLAIGVDGCSVPVFGLPLGAMATAYARLAAAGADEATEQSQARLTPDVRGALARISQAMRTNPQAVAGNGRLDTELMQVCGDRIVSKAGAEAVHCVGITDRGWGIALKVEDGSGRATGPALMAILSRLDLVTDEERAALADRVRPVLHNHKGIEVGRLDAEWVST